MDDDSTRVCVCEQVNEMMCNTHMYLWLRNGINIYIGNFPFEKCAI